MRTIAKLFTLVLTLALCASFCTAVAEEDAPKTAYEIEVETGFFPGENWDIPYTYVKPLLPEGKTAPAVIMLHGTGSSRDEAGNGYVIAAESMGRAGIATLRIDFVGCGESAGSYRDYTLTSAMGDANAAIAFVQAKPEINSNAIGMMGWSQGGTVAMLTASRNNAVKSLVTWAGAVDMSFFEADKYEIAKTDGYATVTFDWREPLDFPLAWFEEVRSISILEELGSYQGALLAIAGSGDIVVPPSDTELIITAAGTEEKDHYIIEGGDHTFNLFTGDMTVFDDLNTVTTDWFLSTL